MKKIPSKVVYTAVFGGYDSVAPVNPLWDCDFVCFTDNPNHIAPGWIIVIIELNDVAPLDANRLYKMMPHIFLPNYEFSLYIDGNIKLTSDPKKLFDKYLNTSVIALPKHQYRNCAYNEAAICIANKLGDEEIIRRQFSRYSNEGFPINYGMTENGIILRRHHDEFVKILMTHWWSEYQDGGKRDQLSLPYLFWRNDANWTEIKEGPRISSEYFQIEPHNKHKNKSKFKKMIWLINSRKYINLYYFTLSNLINIVIRMRAIFNKMKCIID